MTTLTEYICSARNSLYSAGADGSIVYNPSIADAMITCWNIMGEYSRIKKIEEYPLPLAIVNKIDDDGIQSYTLLKFPVEIDVPIIMDIVDRRGINNIVDIEEYNSCINIEIYTINKQ